MSALTRLPSKTNVLRIHTAASRSYSGAMDGCFCLQNAPGVEVEQVQVWWIWRPTRQEPEFRLEPLGGFCSVGWHWIHKKTYFPSGYVLRPWRTTFCLKSSREMLAFTRSLAKTGLWRCKSTRSAAHSARIDSFRLFAVASGPDLRLKAFSHGKPCFCYC